MTTDVAATTGPLWLAMEGKILELSSSDLEGGSKESTIQRLATGLDGLGYNVSRHAGNMLDLRGAVDARIKVGRPLMKDFEEATAALTLEDVADPLKTTITLAGGIGEAWPRLKESARRPDILKIVEKIKLDLLVAKAKEMPDDKGVRFLIGEDVASESILEGLGISEDKLAEVHAALEAERAAIARVEQLLEAVEGQSDEERAKHLVTNDVSDELIVEMAGIGQTVIDSVKQSMEAELAEKKRLEEEAAALKKAEAAGPSLEDIPADELADFIEEIREILEFTDKENEIRQMCEASSIPGSLIDVAVSDPDKLDALEEAAG